MSTLPDAVTAWCDVCDKFTDHYRPFDWQWRLAAGDSAYLCIVCEDATDGAGA